jgi:transcriptional regulator with XRE-family HTH domain
VNDVVVGRVLRALRRRRGWRQRDLADRAGCSQALISEVEAGHVDGTTLGRLRRIFAAVDARIELVPRWRGADLERLVDEAHAAVVAEVVRRLEQAGWTAVVEVTYSEFGERGSIDVLGLLPARRAALVVEVKAEIGSAEATARKLDEKTRLVPRIIENRFGWRPVTVGRVLAMPESSRLRRLLAATPILARSFPEHAATVRSWLRLPVGTIAAAWFLSGISVRNPRRVDPGPRGRRTSSASAIPRREPQDEHVREALAPSSIMEADERQATRGTGEVDRSG